MCLLIKQGALILRKKYCCAGIVTRRPLVLQLHKTDDGTEEYAEFLHLPKRQFTDFGMYHNIYVFISLCMIMNVCLFCFFSCFLGYLGCVLVSLSFEFIICWCVGLVRDCSWKVLIEFCLKFL